MKILSAWMLLVAVVIAASCKKEHNPNPDPQQYVLKSVEYKEAHAKADYSYDAEGFLHQIIYSDGVSEYISSYDYLNGFIKKISVAVDFYEHTYTYLNGSIISILSTQFNHADRSDRLAFSYNSNGTVSELKHYTIGVGGERLLTSSEYEYDNAGRLEKVVSVNTDGMVEWNIESYSAECSFTPFSFLQSKIEDAYEIFNYPVLNKFNRLPAKISKRVHPADGNPYIQKIYSTEFAIQNKRLDRTVTTVTFPESPAYNFITTAIFRY